MSDPFDIYHTRHHYPHWRCTRAPCHGTLQIVDGSLRTEMDYDAQDRMQREHYGFSEADDTGRYTVVLECRHCKDRVMAIGDYGHEEWEFEDIERYVEVFYPKYFVPLCR